MINILTSMVVGGIPVLIANIIVGRISKRYDELPTWLLVGLLIGSSTIMFFAGVMMTYILTGGFN